MRTILLICILFVALPGISQTKKQHIARADAFMERENFSAAMVEIEKALALDPLDSNVFLMKGECFLGLGSLQEAYDVFTECIKKFPRFGRGYNNRGLLLRSVLEFELALADFTTALSFTVDDSSRLGLLINRGYALSSIQNYTAAIKDLEEAYRIDSNSVGVLNNISLAYLETGQRDKTLQYLNRIIELVPNDYGAIHNVGYTFLRMEMYDTAIKMFNRAIEIDDDQAYSYSNRGYCLYKLGKLAEALKDVNRSLEMESTNAYAYRTRALIYIDLKDYEGACADIETAIRFKFSTMYGDEVEKLKEKYCK